MKSNLTTLLTGTATVAVMAASTAFTAAPADAAFPFAVSVDVSNPTGYLPGSNVINFSDPFPAGVTLGGGAIVSGNLSGVYAEPNPTAGAPYLTVGPSGETAGPATLTFNVGNYLNYYGLYWGSADTLNTTWNSLEFLRDGNVIGTYDGSQLNALINPSGGQGVGGSAYVNFLAQGPAGYFNAVKLTAGQFAFESDNHAYRVVPTPAAVLPGLLGMGAAAFRKKKREEGEELAISGIEEA